MSVRKEIRKNSRQDPILEKTRQKKVYDKFKESRRTVVTDLVKQAAKGLKKRRKSMGVEDKDGKELPRKINRTPAKILFQPAVLKEIENLAAIGLPNDDIINCLDISPERFYKERKLHPEIDLALVRGRAKGHAAVVAPLYQQAQAGVFAVASYWLERRHPKDWRPAPVESINHTDLTQTTVNPEVVQQIRSFIPQRADDGGPIAKP